jgi:regulator of replication initiation timing
MNGYMTTGNRALRIAFIDRLADVASQARDVKSWATATANVIADAVVGFVRESEGDDGAVVMQLTDRAVSAEAEVDKLGKELSASLAAYGKRGEEVTALEEELRHVRDRLTDAVCRCDAIREELSNTRTGHLATLQLIRVATGARDTETIQEAAERRREWARVLEDTLDTAKGILGAMESETLHDACGRTKDLLVSTTAHYEALKSQYKAAMDILGETEEDTLFDACARNRNRLQGSAKDLRELTDHCRSQAETIRRLEVELTDLKARHYPDTEEDARRIAQLTFQLESSERARTVAVATAARADALCHEVLRSALGAFESGMRELAKKLCVLSPGAVTEGDLGAGNDQGACGVGVFVAPDVSGAQSDPGG